MYTRRAWLASAAGIAAAVVTGRAAAAAPRAEHELLVYKSPTCGCCKLWVDHMTASGFRATVRDELNLNPMKAELGIPARLQSCHTALVGGYLVEGHVPADVVLELLERKPDALGLVVPGMPMGSPGMEGPRKDAYDVLLLRRDGSTSVFARR